MITNKIKPIGPNDTIHVHGKHLYKKSDKTPFIIKGIAFHTPPESYPQDKKSLRALHGYNATAWLDILRQLRNDLQLEFNTVRMYRMYPESVDYTEFLEGAAALGVYVMVPLTSAQGKGVLDRTLEAPKCYKKKLFGYGARALNTYLRHPNVLAGMVGNEVMNDEEAWLAAPCVRAYARDLKLFMDRMVDEEIFHRTLPLIYATQDSSMIGGADTSSDTVMKLTVDYLTCVENGKGTIVPDTGGAEPLHGNQHFSENKFGQSPIDIFGLNVESWCSSTQNFEFNPDGTIGSYYSLWSTLRNSSVPIIFSEMGCPHSHFDRDDAERKTVEGTRDWRQVSIVMNEMADSWSGFVAYTYDGPEDFVMFEGGPWDGVHVLKPTKDFESFRKELDLVALPNATTAGRMNYTAEEEDGDGMSKFLPRQCSDVEAELLELGVRLFNDDMIRSFSNTVDSHFRTVRSGDNTWMFVVLLMGFTTLAIRKRCRRHKPGYEAIQNENGVSIPSAA